MKTVLRVAAAVLLGASLPAHAHLVNTGFGAYYDGLAHVVMTPADLLVVIAVAMLAGQRGTQAARWALFALAAAWLAGGVLGARHPADAVLPLATTFTFGLAGVLVALDAKLPAAGVALVAVAAGLVHGYANGASMAPGGAGPLALAGAVTAAFCVAAVVAAQATTLKAAWSRIALRVAGSWIAAAGVLMLGWLARPLLAT
jgi:hydrogenase/urease accessory protein HupE